jgi:D-sedoheptulose 7-phosphate isomerase
MDIGMNISTYDKFCGMLHNFLLHVTFTAYKGAEVSVDEGMDIWQRMGSELRTRGGCLYLIGNGASASMSSHFAADLNKNALMRTQVFTDPALLTAVANDISFAQVFAEPLRRMGQEGDMLLAVSSSGSSANILAALEAAGELGMARVTLSGMRQDNPARTLGDLNIYTSAQSYGLVETVHSALLHHWTDRLSASAT